jgi:hypothetical protein
LDCNLVNVWEQWKWIGFRPVDTQSNGKGTGCKLLGVRQLWESYRFAGYEA